MPLCVSVVGTPSESNAHPAGISGCPLRNALNTLPAATVVVAISSSHGPGTDMQIGFVPNCPFFPCHGGTIGEALHITMPICPAARIFCAHHAAAPKWFDSLRHHQRQPLLPRNPHGVRAARLRHPLAQRILPVEMQAASRLPKSRGHPPAHPSRRPATGRHKTAAVGSRANPLRAGWLKSGRRRPPQPCGAAPLRPPESLRKNASVR